MPDIPTITDLTRRQSWLVLAVAFLGWMFAGMEISLFILLHGDMMPSLVSSTITPEESTQWFAQFQAAFLFGAALGGLLFGWLGDRIGRTKALGLSVLCYSGFALACYFEESVLSMLVLRFVACLGIGGAWPNAIALASEAWPDASRPMLAGFLGAAANVGFVLLGAIGYFFEITPQSWRWVLLVATSPIVLGVFCLVAVPESVRWLKSRQVRREGNGPIGELMRPPLLGRLILGMLLGAVPIVGTAANASWVTPWADHVAKLNAEKREKPNARAKASAQMLRSGGATFGSLLGGILATMLGRRSAYFLMSLFTLAASSILFGFLEPGRPWFKPMVFVFGFVGVIYYGWLPLYLPELFPTRVRATGSGVSFNSGRLVAGIVALCTVPLTQLVGGDFAKIGLWTGSIYAVGMLIILFAPNTQNAKLED